MTQTLSLIGVGAFGEFALPHLIPYFDIKIYDSSKDISPLCNKHNVTTGSFEEIAQSDIVIVAVPIHAMESVFEKLFPIMNAGQLLIDVGSVKCKIVEMMKRHFDKDIDIVATHPIFGPQSGKNGIKGQNISVINVQGSRDQGVVAFLRDKLQLNVIECSAEEHDQQMAYVQGLTHMVAKIFKTMDVPEITQASKTYDLLQSMVDLIKNDSDDLFRAIQTDNPYVDDVKSRFFNSVRDIENSL